MSSLTFAALTDITVKMQTPWDVFDIEVTATHSLHFLAPTQPSSPETDTFHTFTALTGIAQLKKKIKKIGCAPVAKCGRRHSFFFV